MPLVKSEQNFVGRSDFTYGLRKDQNIESIICLNFDKVISSRLVSERGLTPGQDRPIGESESE